MIVIFGAGGRAGRAVTAEARRRGHRVTPAVRDPERHPDLDGAVRGDVTDPASVAALVRGHDAAVHAVTPFKGPEQGFDDLDPKFFSNAADALLASGVPRLIVVGLFANLLDASGRPVMDDPAAFPPMIRPFAAAHTAGLDRLRTAQDTGVDWLMLTPPAQLELDGPRTGGYLLGGDSAPDPSARLSYADLAVAIVDEIETPRHHRTRISVFNQP